MSNIRVFLTAREDPSYSFDRGHTVTFDVDLVANVPREHLKPFKAWFTRFVSQHSQGLPFIIGLEEQRTIREPEGVVHTAVDVRGRFHRFATEFFTDSAIAKLNRLLEGEEDE